MNCMMVRCCTYSHNNSLYNRKYHPFLLCTCMRGQGLRRGHICKLITHEEQVNLWNKSQKRWDWKNKNLQSDETYTKNIWISVTNISRVSVTLKSILNFSQEITSDLMFSTSGAPVLDA